MRRDKIFGLDRAFGKYAPGPYLLLTPADDCRMCGTRRETRSTLKHQGQGNRMPGRQSIFEKLL